MNVGCVKPSLEKMGASRVCACLRSQRCGGLYCGGVACGWGMACWPHAGLSGGGVVMERTLPMVQPAALSVSESLDWLATSERGRELAVVAGREAATPYVAKGVGGTASPDALVSIREWRAPQD